MKSILKKQEVQIKLGKSIQKFRIENGMSQEELAEKCGLHRTYIGSVERGERNISIFNLKKISSALNIKLSNLVKSID